MKPSRSGSGDWHPVSAYVYGPTRVQNAAGELNYTTSLILGPTRIKTPTPLFVQERDNQGHANSQIDLRLCIRNEGGGDKLTADQWVLHNGTRYDIKGKLLSDYRAGSTVYQVQQSNDYN